MFLLFKEQLAILVFSRVTLFICWVVFVFQIFFLFFSPFENVEEVRPVFLFLITWVCLFWGNQQMASRGHVRLLSFLLHFPVRWMKVILVKWITFLSFFVVLMVLLFVPFFLNTSFEMLNHSRLDPSVGMANFLKLIVWGGTVYATGLFTGSVVLIHGYSVFLGFLFSGSYFILHFLMFEWESTHEFSLFYPLSTFNTNLLDARPLAFLLSHTCLMLAGSIFLLCRLKGARSS